MIEKIMKTDMDIQLASQYSIHNREQVEASEKAGCYYCMRIFRPEEISDYCDDGTTVLCPQCGIDSVLSSHSGYPINLETLRKLHEYWF